MRQEDLKQSGGTAACVYSISRPAEQVKEKEEEVEAK